MWGWMGQGKHDTPRGSRYHRAHGVCADTPSSFKKTARIAGSKVGSRYKALGASTNDAFCPTIRGITRSQLSPEIGSVMEIVIDGLTADDIAASMKAGIGAVTALGRAQGIHRISAGNYGGKLGKYHFKLREILAS